VLLEMSLDLSELVKKFIVHENFQVLHVIVGLVGTFELLLWLTRIDTLENAETSKVLKSELKLPDSLRTCKVLRLFSLLSLLYFLPHFILSLLFYK
jgi:hypothetical protein